MQFIAKGPDIPDALLQAHEEGRVVFFCGAGISQPAGLPNFKEMVDKIYESLHTECLEKEQQAYCRGQFDTVLNLLERRIPGGRNAVREKLAPILKPDLEIEGAKETHTALLKLSHSRKGALRLVTTNFDQVFEEVAKLNKQSHATYAAPMLPIPKNRWDGLVYLHGILPEETDETQLDRLVLTSGDFGLAYLIERWAARFVGELFRNYVVCFVGYGINDPVLRYMMDALAVDGSLGEITPTAYAFGSYESEQEKQKSIEWETKSVTPILYEAPIGSNDHSALHKTLKVWSEVYRDGKLGKEQIVVEHAHLKPSASTKQDDFVGRMLWAVSDKSGSPAKKFAKINPTPPLDWLWAFSEDCLNKNDLNRFGISPASSDNSEVKFSIIRRPAPYNLAPQMALIGKTHSGEWDKLMKQMAYWLARHLNDPRLFHWILDQGGQLHDNLIRIIEDKLNRIVKLEQENRTRELDEIRAESPNAIPNQSMRTLWRLMLSDQVKSSSRSVALLRCKRRLIRDGYSVSIKMELRNLLRPMVAFRKPYRSFRVDGTPEHIRQIADWKLSLAADNVSHLLRTWDNNIWEKSLPFLLRDFQQLLLDALDLKRELDDADDRRDHSWLELPSIEPHDQNRGFREWPTLIELLRDSWLATRKLDPENSTRIAQRWYEEPYPTFKRLAFFAASRDDNIHSDLWVDW